ncbi:hypothetical protein [Nitrosomonas aestuarii]|uniref:hypothetical protein n=1 Tax=Nitrosomonas aestuarii TaxID=52441 RepID=UPI001113BFAC|nr:hypothetical protein [Nitrosomonas aestuarii]
MSAESHLAKFGVTVPQALNFLVVNIQQPETIFNVASQFAITAEMLSEITNLSPSIVREYFAASGLDASELDETSILVNSDLGALESFVRFNDKTGGLSNESLRELIKPLLNDPSAYDTVFNPQFTFQMNDGIYDAQELGVLHLNALVPATNESIESLFYGSLIKMFSALDQTELNPIVSFPVANRQSNDFQVFVSEALSDIPAKVIWLDDVMVRLVVNESIILINDLVEDTSIVGVLDQSFLGLAVN